MASKDSDKFFWYREYKEDLNDHRRKTLKAVKGGYQALVVLDELKKESVSHEGVLRFSEERAYTIEELAAVLEEPIKILKYSIELLKYYELIHVYEDGTIEILDFKKRIGSETGQTKRKKDGKSVVNFTKDLPQNYQTDTNNLPLVDGKTYPKYQIKSIEFKDYILDYLSSSKDKYYELGMSKEFDQVESMMIKAAKTTNFLPTKNRLIDILNEVIDNNDLFNKQGYLINCFKQECA